MKVKRISLILIVIALWIVSAIAVGRIIGQKLPETRNEKEQIKQTQKLIEEESVVIDVVEKVSPSVVSIAVENRPFFNPFFGLQQPKEKQSGIGTGFVVSKDGLILTNKHVVSEKGATYIAIIRENSGPEKKLTIKEINRDPFNDLALVRVDAGDLKPVEIGDSDNLKVGQKVIAIGNALGQFENTVTTGVVSGLGRGVSPVDPATGVAERLEDLIQTDAAINPGNSGGPLLNFAGQVVGVNVAVASGAQNIGFALPVNVLKDALGTFNQTGSFASKPFLGVEYQMISKQAALLNEVPQGALISTVVTGSPAEKAGVKEGDIIVKIDGESLNSDKGLSDIISKKKAGQEVELEIYRDNQTLKLKATLSKTEE